LGPLCGLDVTGKKNANGLAISIGCWGNNETQTIYTPAKHDPHGQIHLQYNV